MQQQIMHRPVYRLFDPVIPLCIHNYSTSTFADQEMPPKRHQVLRSSLEQGQIQPSSS